jgi:hypothetical protein
MLTKMKVKQKREKSKEATRLEKGKNMKRLQAMSMNRSD